MTPAPPVRPAGRPTALLLALLVVVVALGALLVMGGGPSATAAASARVDACEPVDLGDDAAVRARAKESDAVFYARLRAPQKGGATGQVVSWQVRVIDSLGSRLMPSLLTVRFDTSMVSDVRVLQNGADLVLFAKTPTDQETTGKVLDVDLCTGIGRAPAGDALTQEQREDLEATLVAGTAEDPAEESVPVAFDDKDDRSLSLGRTVAPGGALVLAGLLGLVLVSWAGRQRR
ncbi:hypothetical protein ACFQ0K_09720 [Nocardioides caeni]|uniref:Uncharacterized protein n=1 Tax=Nocardioides caeni TaxID=574700 RepID=A0A4S8N6I7_9ACTN|nr:hypothetical protein [Nocardioides caeni]THV11242.1 hypothetical protein E9934_13230 [Nocardioides caeni]